MTASRTSRRDNENSSARRRVSASGTRTPHAIALRQNAIAKAGATAAAMSGPDVDTAQTATRSSARSVVGGRSTALGRTIGSAPRVTSAGCESSIADLVLVRLDPDEPRQHPFGELALERLRAMRVERRG